MLQRFEILNKTCMFDLDCPSEVSNGIVCSGDYVMESVVEHKCVRYLGEQGYCVAETKNRVLDWCAQGEYCTTSSRECLPQMGAVKEEKKAECVGESPLCHPQHTGGIECFSDSECGPFEWVSEPYCGEYDNVVRDYVEHKCIYAGTPQSRCVNTKEVVRIEYCGPGAVCKNAKCIYDYNTKKYCEDESCCSTKPAEHCNPQPAKINYLDYAVTDWSNQVPRPSG